MPGATHTSCTIEMTNMFRRVDVAVVDEVQVQNPDPPAPCMGCRPAVAAHKVPSGSACVQSF